MQQIITIIKAIRVGLNALALLLLFLLLAGAIYFRSTTLAYYLAEQDTTQQIRFVLPSVFYYLGAFLWLLSVSLNWFKKRFITRFLTLILLSLFMLLDTAASVLMSMLGDGTALFSAFYLITQTFNVGFSYLNIKWALWVCGLLFVWLSVLQAKEKGKRSWLLLSLICLACSFIGWGRDLPRSVSLSPISYLLASADKTPVLADFQHGASAPEPSWQGIKQIDQRVNIVIIVLESTRKEALSFYHPTLKRKTDFFDSLAENGLAFDNMYSTVPFTIKALSSINCGIYPYLNYPILESVLGLPHTCLAKELENFGYQSLFMQSATVHFGNKRSLAKQWGFGQFYGAEDLNREHFKSQVLGFDDNIMLQKNQQWLSQQKAPFYAMYLTLGPHWPYVLYGDADQRVDYSEGKQNFYLKDAYNNYLNAVYHQDQFLQKLFEQFKQTGHFDNTVFILMADHGESFGEHRHFQHDNNLYQEVLNTPFVIYAPKLIPQGRRVDNLVNIADVPQMLSNLLNSRAVLQGIEHKQLYASCWYFQWCIARVDKHYKFIDNFADAPDELYDLQKDPKEQTNIAANYPAKVQQFKQETRRWYQSQLAWYGKFYFVKDPLFYLRGHPNEEAFLKQWKAHEQH